MYILPMYRFTSYAIGIYSGLVLRKMREIKKNSTQLYFIWMLAFSALLISLRFAAELTDEEIQPFASSFDDVFADPVLYIFLRDHFNRWHEEKSNSKLFIEL